MLNVLDLFSGIGGFSLGLERTGGFRTVAFCEIEPYCRAVLRKHWPDVPCFEDVRLLHSYDVGPVDVICGGFPCQDISGANPGGGSGLAGERSGLWSEYRRLIEECRPAWVIIENVSALRSRGLDQVLREISALGYDAEWHCIPASAVGAPHRRDRIWIAAHRNTNGDRESTLPVDVEAPRLSCFVADALCEWFRDGGRGEAAGPQGEVRRQVRQQRLRPDVESGGEVVGNATSEGLPHWAGGEVGQPRPLTEFERPGGREIEFDFRGVAHGVSKRVDRLRALGNAVVPQIPEIIGRAILEAEALTS